MATPTPALLSVAQAAEELQLTRRAVIHRIHAGRIPATKIGTGRTSAYAIAAEVVENMKREQASRVSA